MAVYLGGIPLEHKDVEIAGSKQRYTIKLPPKTWLFDEDTNYVTFIYWRFQNGQTDVLSLVAKQSRIRDRLIPIISDFVASEVTSDLTGSQVMKALSEYLISIPMNFALQNLYDNLVDREFHYLDSGGSVAITHPLSTYGYRVD
jgi:hypothetical protein